MSKLSIRPAVAKDATLVFAFITALAEYEKMANDVAAGEADIATALFAEHPRVFCDIAEWGGEPAGFALWFYNFSTFRGRHGIYLEDLFVKPAFRGKGIGKVLLANLAKRALAQNCARVEWSVLDWNAPSIDFYKSLGAKPMDEWTIFRLTDDALGALAKQAP
ncbi:MAG TPA: GNAT family N-acetyltransferase [Rhizomicrobium sp.]|jgi:diamine N-acetyltransferase